MSENATPPELPPRSRGVMKAILRYLAAYLGGIAACVIFTPVKLVLVGFPVGLLFPLLAVPGVLAFYFYLDSGYVWGDHPAYWPTYWLGLVTLALGVAVSFGPLRRFRCWRPLLLGFPVGFIGTLGVYYGAASSV